MCKIDLKETYFTISIHKESREFQHARSCVPVHMPAIWPIMCSLGLNRDPEAGHYLSQMRLVAYINDILKAKSKHPELCVSTGEPQLHSASSKEDPRTITKMEFFWGYLWTLVRV